MRVHAHRGNTLAAGAVVLAAAVVEAELRSGTTTAVRVALLVLLASVAALGALGSPVEAAGLRAYQELLLAITALAVTGLVAHGLDLSGASPGRPVEAFWVAVVAGAGAVVALVLARVRSATIVLGLGAAAAVLALVAGTGAAWTGDDPRVGIRWALLAAAVVLVGAIMVRIDRRYQQAVALADALAGVVVLLAATFLVDDVRGAAELLGLPRATEDAGLGWQLLMLTAGFALAGLGATLHERGPGWLGALALVASLGVLARDGGGFAGWPLVLVAVAAVLVAVALRPVAHRGVVDDPVPDDDLPPPVPFRPRGLARVPPDRDRGDADDLL
ncbi:hypothetical protein [Patulibacter minatonensis]|uniref:hypothetical protein n=1 Tax=Patulibacter minatonensis TaxID=298163 RepID=UPI0012F90670|nr:hypothetical protein [Patulibacter minatonensis]